MVTHFLGQYPTISSTYVVWFALNIYKEWIDQKSFDLPSDSHSIKKYYLYADHLEIVYHNPCRDTSEHYVDAHSF